MAQTFRNALLLSSHLNNNSHLAACTYQIIIAMLKMWPDYIFF